MMNSKINTTDDPFCVDESRELLAEVRAATGDCSQPELHEFACLLLQLLDLYQRTSDDSNRNAEIASLIADGIEEIGCVVSADESTSAAMESLRSVAIERWGERLTAIDDHEFDGTPADATDDWEMDEESEVGEQCVAPTAAEINSLMTKLGSGSLPKTSEVSPQTQSQEPYESSTCAESTSVAIQALDGELREAFMDDASSCLGSMEASLLRLESDPQDAESLNQICRELHTLKGASGSVGLTELAEYLHELEDRLRDDQAAGRPSCIDSLLRSIDWVRVQIRGGEMEPPTPQVAASVNVVSQPVVASEDKQEPSFHDTGTDDESVRVKSSQLNRLMDMLAELVMLRNRRETELSDLQEVYHDLIGSVSQMRLISHEEPNQVIASSSLQLSEIANDVLEVAQHVRDCARPVAEGNTAVSQFIRQFRQELVELRRTPISGLFRRLQRVVRDAAQAESKEVRLQLLGEDAGIERSLLQRLYEPLLHIVRNSVCHGIESPQERSRDGKNRAGTITLEAKSLPDLLVIEIRDDGRGLDYDAIRRRGVESGLLAADQAASREELSQLIFRPGFSTRATTSQVAGRGVGMDVVASTLARMRGWLEVDSVPQQGTQIRLSFPLPSVIQHAMVFRSGNQLFALPMQSVKSAGEIDHATCLLRFSDLLETGSNESVKSCQGIELACEAPASLDSVSGHSGVTMLVDEIVGPEEVVVRPLPTLLKQHPFCSGATMSGMGQTVLLLDARRLVETQSCHLHRSSETLSCDQPTGQHDPTNHSRAARPTVLVVDDSRSARTRVVRSLQRYPIEVVEASDGREALEILKTKSLAAVFSDMEMPHVSGMELLAEINSGDRVDAPPVVIISSRSEEEFTDRAKQLGVHRYLIKPLSDEALDGALSGIELLEQLVNTPPTKS